MSNRANRIMVVDPDDKSRRIIEVSLRKAGHDPTGVATAREALEALEAGPIDLVMTETELPDVSGFDFCQHVRSVPSLEGVPFIFISGRNDKAEKLRALELGVEDYLAKPVYVSELRARVDLALRRRETELLAEAQAPTVSGRLRDVTLLDLFRTIEAGKKTGALRLDREGRRAVVYFSGGEPIDARADLLVGEEAVYRLLTWDDGEYTLKVLPSIRRPRRIQQSFTDLVVEGLTRSEQYAAVSDEVSAERRVLRADYAKLAARIDQLPEPVVELVHLFDGRRPIGAIVDASPLGDLASIRVVQRLLDEGLLEEVGVEDEDDMIGVGFEPSDALGDWLGAETAEQRNAREAREAKRRQEEEQLHAELDALQAMQTDLEARLRAADEARRAAEIASVELRERQQDIERRLTGDHRHVGAGHPVTGFRPTPSAKRQAVGARTATAAASEPSGRRVSPTTGAPLEGKRPRTDEDVADWLGLTTQAEAPKSGEDVERDTFDYPALKVPADAPADEDVAPQPPATETKRVGGAEGFRSRRNRIDTNPRFRSDMAAESVSPELMELRQSVDSERKRLEEARRQARDEERRASESQRALERAKNAYEELERAEELRRLQAEQGRLEAERRALVAQRERLQNELEAERAQLQREKNRLETAAEARRRAQQEEEERLRAELEQARLEREAEERRLGRQRAEAERLKVEVERQEAALREKSGDRPAVPESAVRPVRPAAPEPVEPSFATPAPVEEEPEATPFQPLEERDDKRGVELDKPTQMFSPLPAETLPEEPEEPAEDDHDDTSLEQLAAASKADALARASEVRPHLKAVDEARRRLLEAAERSERRLHERRSQMDDGPRLDTPGAGLPRVTQRTPTDTPHHLAAISESKRRLSTLVQESLSGDRSERSLDDERQRQSQPTPPSGVRVVDPSARPAQASAAADQTPQPAEAGVARSKEPGDDFFVGRPLPDDDAQSEVVEHSNDFDHGFFTGEHDYTGEHDDLYAALYDEGGSSRRGRNLLVGGAVVVVATAIVVALVASSGSGGDDAERPTPPPGPTEEEVAEWTAAAQTEARHSADEVSTIVASLGQELAVDVAFELAAETVDGGLQAASGPEEDGGEPVDDGLVGVDLQDTDAFDTDLVEATPDDDDETDGDEADDDDEVPLAFISRPGDDETDEDDAVAEAIDIEEAAGRADDLLDAGDFGEAAAQARLVLESAPNDRRAHQILGESLLNLDEARNAIPHLEAATSSGRPDERALMLLGNAQLDSGHEEAAYATYRRYIELYPDREEAAALRDFLASQ